MDSTNLKTRLEGKVQALETSITPYIALTNNALDIIQENLKHQPLSVGLFDLVKSPAGGSTVFSVPGLSGEEAEKELAGIILDYTTPRAYWDTPDPVEGTPPVCCSRDSIISESGKPCARCPFNDFGSKNGESSAKACKESVLLFLLRPNSILPLLVRIPVSSKILFLKYMTRLVSQMKPLHGVVTKITLEKATSKEGKPYALYQFDAVHFLDPQESNRVKEFANQFMDMIHASDIESDLSEAS